MWPYFRSMTLVLDRLVSRNYRFIRYRLARRWHACERIQVKPWVVEERPKVRKESKAFYLGLEKGAVFLVAHYTHTHDYDGLLHLLLLAHA